MKQIYYTSCLPGRSVTGAGGFQVRAVSRGVPEAAQREVLRCARYLLPTGMAEAVPPQEAPRKLALVETPQGRVLCHSAYVGQDQVTHRFGNFFAHLLLEVPAAVDAGQAAATWGHPFWRTADRDGPTALDDVERLPAAADLAAAELSDLARRHEPLLRFLLVGLLTAPLATRLFVAAAPAVVCLAVRGLARLLPPTLLTGLTFSTYESDPLACAARIVGTVLHQPGLDLPAACYQGTGLGYNAATGRASPLPAAPAVAAYLLDLAARGQVAELDAFRAEGAALAVADPRTYDLAYRLLRGGTVSRADVEQGAAHPGLVSRLLARPGLLPQVVGWVAQDAAFRTAVWPVLRRALPPALTAPFGQALRAEALAALRQGDLDRARALLEEVLPQVDPAGAAALPAELAGQLRPQELAPRVRLYLLPRVAGRGANSAGLDDWLRVPAADLGALLALPLDEAPRLRAADLALAAGAEAAAVLAGHRALALRLLPRVAADPSRGPQVLALVQALGPAAEVLDALHHLEATGRLARDRLDECLGGLFADARLDARAYVMARGLALLGQVPQGRSPARLVERLLRDHPDAPGTDPEVGPFLAAFQAHPAARTLTLEARELLQRRLGLADFLERPGLATPALEAAAVGLRSVTRRRLRNRLARLVVRQAGRCLATYQPADKVQERLEAVLEHLGPVTARPAWWPPNPRRLFGGGAVLPGSWADLYRQLTGLILADRQARINVPLVSALVMVGFQAGIRSAAVRQAFEGARAEPPDGTLADAVAFVRQLRRKAPEVVELVGQRLRQPRAPEPVLDWWKFANAAAADQAGPRWWQGWLGATMITAAAFAGSLYILLTLADNPKAKDTAGSAVASTVAGSATAPKGTTQPASPTGAASSKAVAQNPGQPSNTGPQKSLTTPAPAGGTAPQGGGAAGTPPSVTTPPLPGTPPTGPDRQPSSPAAPKSTLPKAGGRP